jgi:hypothetical protein
VAGRRRARIHANAAVGLSVNCSRDAAPAFLGVRSRRDSERQPEGRTRPHDPGVLAAVIELYHRAAVPFVRGDCEPSKAVFSHHADVSVGNPFGLLAWVAGGLGNV